MDDACRWIHTPQGKYFEQANDKKQRYSARLFDCSKTVVYLSLHLTQDRSYQVLVAYDPYGVAFCEHRR
ncbi:MAG: hypothetical protein K0R82_1435 [Flavipsychrobacter sp.]|jgi:hypothetical protein|nr:hypothetical protein [Flavipsychrobacter sp.]